MNVNADRNIDAPELTGGNTGAGPFSMFTQPNTPNTTGTPGTPGLSTLVPAPGTGTGPAIPNIAPATGGAPVGVNAGDATAYVRSGSITADQVINGDPDLFEQYLPVVADVLAHVQQGLIAQNKGELINQARRGDKELRDEIAVEADRLAMAYMTQSRKARGDTGRFVIASVVNELIGLGPLEPLWLDPSITEVIVNGPRNVFVEQHGRLKQAKACLFRDQEHLLSVCERILTPLNRKVDVRDPLTDGRLPDGSRVNVVHQVIAPSGPLLTIRRFPENNLSLTDLVGLGAMDPEMATLLATLVAAKTTCIVAGGTGSGKTTLLNALSAVIPSRERLVTIEDSLELRFAPWAHVAPMEARPPDSAGQNAVTIRQLVKNALRMRPDRIVVGEIRDAAALDMLQACNTGHEGSMSTVHANGPDEALSRLTVMVAQGGEIPANKVDWLIASAIDVIVTVNRYEDGARRISGVYEVPDVATWQEGTALRTIPLWEWEQTGVDTKTGKAVGEYVKRHDISPELMKRKRLEHAYTFTWDDLLALSRGDFGAVGKTKPATATTTDTTDSGTEGAVVPVPVPIPVPVPGANTVTVPVPADPANAGDTGETGGDVDEVGADIPAAPADTADPEPEPEPDAEPVTNTKPGKKPVPTRNRPTTEPELAPHAAGAPLPVPQPGETAYWDEHAPITEPDEDDPTYEDSV